MRSDKKKFQAISNFINWAIRLPKFNSKQAKEGNYFKCENKYNCHSPSCYCEPKTLSDTLKN